MSKGCILLIFNFFNVLSGIAPNNNTSRTSENPIANKDSPDIFLEKYVFLMRTKNFNHISLEKSREYLISHLSNLTFHKTFTRKMLSDIIHCVSMEINTNRSIVPKGLEVIDSIYDAAKENMATVHEVICFTAIALHNMYCFANFENCDESSNQIWTCSRGLLQFRDYVQYKKLDVVSRYNYMKYPFLLNAFSKRTINDEFVAFLTFYYENRVDCNVEKFIQTIWKLGGSEEHLITKKVAEQIKSGLYEIKNDEEKRIYRRFRIYYLLEKYILYDNAIFTSEIKK